MKVSKRELKQIIREEKEKIIFERKLLTEDFGLTALLGAGLLTALSSRPGRSLLSKILRITGSMFDKLETIDDRILGAAGLQDTAGAKILDAISEIVAEMHPTRMIFDELADLFDGMSPEEGDALNDALKPVKMTTAAGQLASQAEKS